MKERNKKNEVGKRKKTEKSYSVMYPESSGLLTLKLELEAVEEVVLVLEVELLDVSFSTWALERM